MIELPPPLVLPSYYEARCPAIIRTETDVGNHFPALLDHNGEQMAALPGMVPVIAGRPSSPTVINTNGGYAPGTTLPIASFALPLPAAIVAGNLLLIVGTTNNNAAITVAGPAGWTTLFNAIGQGSVRRHWCFYKTASGGEGANASLSSSIEAHWSGSSYQIGRWQGTPQAGTISNATTSTPNPPAITPSWGSSSQSLIIATEVDDVNTVGTIVAPSGYQGLLTHFNSVSGQAWSRISTAWKLIYGNEDPGPFTIPASGVTSAQTIAVRGS